MNKVDNDNSTARGDYELPRNLYDGGYARPITNHCQACNKRKAESEFKSDSDVCDDCIAASDITECCEPCAKLDKELVYAIKQIDDTWVCERCAHAIEFMKIREREYVTIQIRLGKVPF